MSGTSKCSGLESPPGNDSFKTYTYQPGTAPFPNLLPEGIEYNRHDRFIQGMFEKYDEDAQPCPTVTKKYAKVEKPEDKDETLWVESVIRLMCYHAKHVGYPPHANKDWIYGWIVSSRSQKIRSQSSYRIVVNSLDSTLRVFEEFGAVHWSQAYAYKSFAIPTVEIMEAMKTITYHTHPLNWKMVQEKYVKLGLEVFYEPRPVTAKEVNARWYGFDMRAYQHIRVPDRRPLEFHAPPTDFHDRLDTAMSEDLPSLGSMFVVQVPPYPLEQYCDHFGISVKEYLNANPLAHFISSLHRKLIRMENYRKSLQSNNCRDSGPKDLSSKMNPDRNLDISSEMNQDGNLISSRMDREGNLDLATLMDMDGAEVTKLEMQDYGIRDLYHAMPYGNWPTPKQGMLVGVEMTDTQANPAECTAVALSTAGPGGGELRLFTTNITWSGKTVTTGVNHEVSWTKVASIWNLEGLCLHQLSEIFMRMMAKRFEMQEETLSLNEVIRQLCADQDGCPQEERLSLATHPRHFIARFPETYNMRGTRVLPTKKDQDDDRLTFIPPDSDKKAGLFETIASMTTNQILKPRIPKVTLTPARLVRTYKTLKHLIVGIRKHASPDKSCLVGLIDGQSTLFSLPFTWDEEAIELPEGIDEHPCIALPFLDGLTEAQVLQVTNKLLRYPQCPILDVVADAKRSDQHETPALLQGDDQFFELTWPPKFGADLTPNDDSDFVAAINEFIMASKQVHLCMRNWKQPSRIKKTVAKNDYDDVVQGQKTLDDITTLFRTCLLRILCSRSRVMIGESPVKFWVTHAEQLREFSTNCLAFLEADHNLRLHRGATTSDGCRHLPDIRVGLGLEEVQAHVTDDGPDPLLEKFPSLKQDYGCWALDMKAKDIVAKKFVNPNLPTVKALYKFYSKLKTASGSMPQGDVLLTAIGKGMVVCEGILVCPRCQVIGHAPADHSVLGEIEVAKQRLKCAQRDIIELKQMVEVNKAGYEAKIKALETRVADLKTPTGTHSTDMSWLQEGFKSIKEQVVDLKTQVAKAREHKPPTDHSSLDELKIANRAIIGLKQTIEVNKAGYEAQIKALQMRVAELKTQATSTPPTYITRLQEGLKSLQEQVVNLNTPPTHLDLLRNDIAELRYLVGSRAAVAVDPDGNFLKGQLATVRDGAERVGNTGNLTGHEKTRILLDEHGWFMDNLVDHLEGDVSHGTEDDTSEEDHGDTERDEHRMSFKRSASDSPGSQPPLKTRRGADDNDCNDGADHGDMAHCI